MTPSETLVFDLCTRSFLSLWSYANPRRPNGKELCDVLLVFGERIIIFSVKEISLKKHADPEVTASRWLREAVDASVDQLLGAKRQLAKMNRVIRDDGSDGIVLSAVEKRQIHLIAVAAGGERMIPFAGGERSEGEYIHVMDEFALREILGELDTTPDFLHYLDSKEAFMGTSLCEGEENLLAFYLHRGRKFPAELHMLVVEAGLWGELQKKSEFRARKKEDRVSYWWDDIIERLIQDYEVQSNRGPSVSDHERVVRAMAAENRFTRRILSGAMLEWLGTKQVGARTIVSPSDVAYVFATYPRDWSREHRTTELMARCLVARSPSVTGRSTVIGLATEVYHPSGFSIDAVYMHLPDWSSQNEEAANLARERCGILRDPTIRRASIDEFPQTTPERNKR